MPNPTRNRKVASTVVLLMNVLLGTAFAFALTFAAAATSAAPVVDSKIGHRPVAPEAAWNPNYAEMFPGCVESLPEGQIPSAVIEVRGGYPVRVDFSDAWKRTHDGGDSNNGEIVGACR